MDKAAREKARKHLGEYATPFRETLREALAALDAADSDNARLQARVAELEAAQQWRPISEAPKDGTSILVWIAGAELPFTARWSISQRAWKDMQRGEGFRPWPTIWHDLPAPPVGDR